MPDPTVLYGKKADGRIVVITLNRPESMNSMSRQLMRELAQAWTDFATMTRLGSPSSPERATGPSVLDRT